MNEILNETNAGLGRYAEMAEASMRTVQGPFRELKQQALKHFLNEGFPTTRLEEWRYTNTALIARGLFEPPSEITTPRSADIAPFLLEGADHFVFVDGLFSRQLSSSPSSISALFFPLGELLRQNVSTMAHLGSHASVEGNPFTALNTALFTDGAFLSIPEGVALERPIQLLFVSSGGSRTVVSSPRVLIVAEQSSQAQIIESYTCLNDGAYWTNAVTEISVGNNAQIDHYKVQQESEQAFHTARIQVQALRDSRVSSHSLSFGSLLARNDIGTTLAGEGSSCVLNGLYLARGHQHVDHHTMIDHASPHSTSKEFYKGILDDFGRGVFDGKIMVRKDAQKTNSGQVSKNLLLSNTSIADTKPQLEIYADDVKCTHGSTIGQLDEQALFYLRSRGLGERESRSILIHGFAGEVLEQIRIPGLRVVMERLLSQRLPSEVVPV